MSMKVSGVQSVALNEQKQIAKCVQTLDSQSNCCAEKSQHLEQVVTHLNKVLDHLDKILEVLEKV